MKIYLNSHQGTQDDGKYAHEAGHSLKKVPLRVRDDALTWRCGDDAKAGGSRSNGGEFVIADIRAGHTWR